LVIGIDDLFHLNAATDSRPFKLLPGLISITYLIPEFYYFRIYFHLRVDSTGFDYSTIHKK
jgi:hypothetical protein